MSATGHTDLDMDVPAQAVPALREALRDRLRAVVLFGSRARGDHHPESDWDVLVIAEGLSTRPLDRYQEVKRALPPDVRGAVALLATTPEEFERHLPELYLDIALDGQVLYEQGEYASQRLARLRQIIDGAGLYGESTDAGNVWKWRTPPEGRWSVEWDDAT